MKLKLADNFINSLVKLPETGMGYQLVKVILQDGKVLHNHTVLNCSLLVLDNNENISNEDIKAIELE